MLVHDSTVVFNLGKCSRRVLLGWGHDSQGSKGPGTAAAGNICGAPAEHSQDLRACMGAHGLVHAHGLTKALTS